jgi:hypothetical protein
MAALLDIEAADATVSDPDISADLSSGLVDVELTIAADGPVAAMAKALATLRAAVHATGDGTPGWETAATAMHVVPADTDDTLLVTT